MKRHVAALLATCLVIGAIACAEDPPTAPVDEATPSDVALFGKPAPGPHTYELVFGGPWTFAEAKKAASRLPAIDGARPHLATFTTETEWTANIAPPSVQRWCWIGLYQNSRKATFPYDGWSWVTREDVTWTDWNSGEPNDGNGLEDGDQDVAYVNFGPTWSWWDDVYQGSQVLDCMIVEWE